MTSARAKRVAGIVGAFAVVVGAFLMLRLATASDNSRAMFRPWLGARSRVRVGGL